ncbi:MAG: hypothetical protein IAI49_08900 [Candidatus Eremiobacteraeota bacterium]|nr:hypothetical protein [Candidatus Eremiobacteraeota bacterium]
MPGPSRFLSIAVATAAGLWLAAYALQVNPAVLQRDAIVFGIVGVLVAAAVETFLKRRDSTHSRGRAADPIARATTDANANANANASPTTTATASSAMHATANRDE